MGSRIADVGFGGGIFYFRGGLLERRLDGMGWGGRKRVVGRRMCGWVVVRRGL